MQNVIDNYPVKFLVTLGGLACGELNIDEREAKFND